MSVGYKNPPKEHRFKEGLSGNSRGRPRQALQLLPAAYLFRKVAREEVEIEIDGVTVVMTRWEALIRQIHIMAHSNPSAARLLHRVRQKFPGTAVPDVKSILVFTDNEMKY